MYKYILNIEKHNGNASLEKNKYQSRIHSKCEDLKRKSYNSNANIFTSKMPSKQLDPKKLC
jgi:hypothetical protein